MQKKLMELVEQNQFELLIENTDRDRLRKEKTDLRLVYLMNDAVESFLVFRKATMTGSYIENFEGEIRIHQESDENQQILILHQEDHVSTIFYQELDFEVHLYDYSRVGHFWVDGYEYLRQLEFKIAILGDKYQYIGAEACSKLETELVKLVHFPPLSYLFYPAVSEAYLVPREDPWLLSEEAVEVMRTVADRAGDSSFRHWLDFYERVPAGLPGKLAAKMIAEKLHRTKHLGIVKELMKMFSEACKEYPRRNEIDSDLLLQEEQEDVVIFMEEPFEFAGDGIGLHVYRGKWEYGRINAEMRIEEIENIR